MDKKRIEELENAGELRRRSPDKARIRSMLEAAKRTSEYVCRLEINEESAAVVFRELYECLRQIGDALLWRSGWEPLKHTASIEALKEEVGYVDYEKLDRLRIIRNNANYRGYSVSVQNALEIKELWEKWGRSIEKMGREGVIKY